MSNIYDMTDTWNNGATVFTAVKMNVTNTASNASSLLYDYQVGGVSKTSFQLDGQLNAPFFYATSNIFYAGNGFRADDAGVYHGNGTYFGWRSGASSGAVDTSFTRVAAGIVKVSDNSTGAGVLVTQAVAVASLPSAATAGAGARAFVTDALTTLPLGLGTTVANGGANKVPVYSDGTNWKYG